MQYPLRDRAYRDRLHSYAPPYNGYSSGVTKEQLAEAGFRYEGCEDQVRCDYCGGGLKGWKEGDSPLDEHKRYFPNCSFLKPLLSLPKHQEYTNFRERMDSFPTSHSSTNPSVSAFAECGFFSHSAITASSNEASDTVACYHCGITLARWNPGDDVWKEHAWASPDCGFLIQSKGPDYVIQIQSARSRGHSVAPSPMIVQQTSLRAVTEIESRSVGTSPIPSEHRRRNPTSVQFVPLPQSAMTSPNFHSARDYSVAGNVSGSVPPGVSRASPLNISSFSALNLASPPPPPPPPTSVRQSPTQSVGLRHSPQLVHSVPPPVVLSSTPPPGSSRMRISRRSPIQLSQTRISPYTIPRNSINSRTPEPLPETNDVTEEQVRRMYENLVRQRECKVCLSNLATVCFLPCRHLSACPACAPKLQNCHVCRTRIDKRFDVYLS